MEYDDQGRIPHARKLPAEERRDAAAHAIASTLRGIARECSRRKADAVGQARQLPQGASRDACMARARELERLEHHLVRLSGVPAEVLLEEGFAGRLEELGGS